MPQNVIGHGSCFNDVQWRNGGGGTILLQKTTKNGYINDTLLNVNRKYLGINEDFYLKQNKRLIWLAYHYPIP